jgi:hypothetical protein
MYNGEIRVWMLVYTVIFGIISVGFIFSDFTDHYSTAYITWNALCYVVILVGNLLYSLDYITKTIRKTWKLIFPILVFEFILTDVVDFLYGSHAHKVDLPTGCFVWVIGLILFLPTFKAHFMIGYGK